MTRTSNTRAEMPQTSRKDASSQAAEGTLLYSIYDGDFRSHSGFLFINTLLRIPAKTLRRNVKKQLNAITPGDTVVIEYGGNVFNFRWDEISVAPEASHVSSTSVDDVRQFYNAVLSYVRRAGGVPVLLTMPAVRAERMAEHVCQGLNRNSIMSWMGDSESFVKRHQEPYNHAISEIGSQFGAPVLDINHLLDQRDDADSYYESDGIHPNEAGRALIVERIKKFYF
ncbi:MAG: SGNH/GDSL hydrolase family protein [Bacteroidales bacterium]|nr:SGNH/GDSL hydrolase family protein [Bacteroidales bacterium]